MKRCIVSCENTCIPLYVHNNLHTILHVIHKHLSLKIFIQNLALDRQGMCVQM